LVEPNNNATGALGQGLKIGSKVQGSGFRGGGFKGSGVEQRTAEPQNNEPQNVEGWIRFAQSFYKIDRIHSFDIRHSLFDIRFYTEPLNPER
jgi:hypothetical protein